MGAAEIEEWRELRRDATATHYHAATLPLGEALDLDAEVHWDSMRRGGFIPGVDAFVAQFG